LVASLLLIVTVITLWPPSVVPEGFESATVKVSAGSARVSSVIKTEMAFEVSPTPKFRVPSACV
jgi:hypothetical protein